MDGRLCRLDRIDNCLAFLLGDVDLDIVQRHALGTDPLGRDILSRLIVGARVSLSTALAVVAIAGSIGIALGLAAGYLGGKWETVIMGSILASVVRRSDGKRRCARRVCAGKSIAR